MSEEEIEKKINKAVKTALKESIKTLDTKDLAKAAKGYVYIDIDANKMVTRELVRRAG